MYAKIVTSRAEELAAENYAGDTSRYKGRHIGPTNDAVITALCEHIARLESRIARLEKHEHTE